MPKLPNIYDPDLGTWVTLVPVKNGYTRGPGGLFFRTTTEAFDAAPQSRWLRLRDGRVFDLIELQGRSHRDPELIRLSGPGVGGHFQLKSRGPRGP